MGGYGHRTEAIRCRGQQARRRRGCDECAQTRSTRRAHDLSVTFRRWQRMWGFFKLSYDPRKDLQPVLGLVSPGCSWCPTTARHQTHNWPRPEIQGRQTSAELRLWGVGTGGHLFGTLLSDHLGAPLSHVPYRGSMPGLADIDHAVMWTSYMTPFYGGQFREGRQNAGARN